MIEIKGYSGSGFRFFYPWLRQVDGGHPRVIPLPKQALIQKLGLINAAVAFLVSGSLIWTRLSHAAIGSGWIYEVALGLANRSHRDRAVAGDSARALMAAIREWNVLECIGGLACRHA